MNYELMEHLFSLFFQAGLSLSLSFILGFILGLATLTYLWKGRR